MTLKSFPRGGKKPLGKKSTDLFKIPEKFSKKNREKQRSRKDDETERNFVATTADRLSYLTISEGLVVLGCIFEATDYDLMISLPGGLIGRAHVADISESYTNLLQNLIQTKDVQPNEFKALPELYSAGDYVVCYVKSIKPEEKWQIVLSLDPRLINQNLDISYLDNGSRMLCTISSIEDHGYVVCSGLNNARAFIPVQNNNERSFYPGKQLLCTVEDIKIDENTSTIKLSTKQKHVTVPIDTEIKSLDSLMPGTKFELYVKKVLSNGLYVSFGGSHIGYINQLYLNEPLTKYIPGMEITGTLLYILPTVKFGYFSLSVGKRRNDALQLGDIIDEATTLFRESGGVALQLAKNGIMGLVSLKRTDVNYEQIIEKFVPGTKHKCRVLSYSWMDAVYICTMQLSLLEQKYFSVSDFKVGGIVNVRIASINPKTGFVNVQIGKINGQVAPEHVSDEGLSALKRLKIDKEVEARILNVNATRRKVHFTLKKSLITSNLPVLSNIREAKRGTKYHGTIVQINKGGLLVKFFGNVKGWAPRTSLNNKTSEMNWNYSMGQTILVRIESVDENLGKIILSVPNADTPKKKENVFVIGEHVEGTIIDSSTQGVYLRISKNDGQDVSTGFLPAGHMSPCMETATLLASKCIPGDTLSALVFATLPSLILTRTFLTHEQYRSFEQLKVGDCISCSVKDIEPNGVRVILPVTGCTPFGYISYSNISNFNLLHVHQILFGKIISINRKEKLINLSLSLKKLYDGLIDSHSRIMAAVDTLTLYFNKLTELAKNPFYNNRPISSVMLGQKVTGKVDKITVNGLVVKLENGLLGIVSKNHYSRSPKVGDTVSGTVMWKNYVHELVELTMIPAVMRSINELQDKHLEIPPDKLIRGEILMVTNWFVLIVLKGHGKGSLAAMPAKRHMNDVRPDLSPYVVHSKLRCYIVLNSNESDIMPICMVKSAFEKKRNTETKPATNKLKRKQMISESEEIPVKKLKSEKTELDVKPPNRNKKTKVKLEETSEEIDELSKTVERTRGKELRKIKEEAEAKDIKPFKDIIRKVDTDADNYNEDKKTPRIPECGFFWDDKPDLDLLAKESSSDSEDDTEEEPTQKKKKLRAAERREQERQMEREICEREEALAGNQLPKSVDQFERLILANPDSSIIWLQYMAYHLQSTEIEKARAVTRKAVKTINFREENERLNIWNAWLNLESKFGTPESLNNVFQDAVRSNDALKIYTHMLTVHLEAGRQFELEKIINAMIGKFKQNPQVWIDCGATLLKMGLKDKSRHIMQRALQSLPVSEHVNLMARFATLENKLGDKERAQTLFEQILSSYPKRVDIWSCYVDSLVKSNDIDIARKVLERAVVQTLPPRKMRSLFKKFINFEEQHGTEEDVSRVQQMAAEYVEKQCNQED